MKKLLLVLGLVLALAASAAAYETIVTMTISDMRCLNCTNGDTLTTLLGMPVDNGIFVSEDNCATAISDPMQGQNKIEVGQPYSSGIASLTSAQGYYFCLQLKERQHNLACAGCDNTEYDWCFNPASMARCDSKISGCGGTVYIFDFEPHTVHCGNNYRYDWHSYIGASTVQDTITLKFPFIA